MADYSKLTDPEIKELVSPYDLGVINRIYAMEGGQANSSFKIETPEGVYILSVCDEKDENEIECLTQTLLHLEDKGFPTSRLVTTRDNERFVRFNEKPAYVKKYMAGRVINELTPLMLEQVGNSLARLHKVPPPGILPDEFPYGIQAFSQVFDVDHEFADWIKDRTDYLNGTVDLSMERCFIHGDLFWDNLLFRDDQLQAVLDFEEACRYFKLYDMGVCVVGCCTTDGLIDLEKAACLIRGYGKVTALSPDEQQQLKVFIEYAAVAGAFWRFRQYNIRNPNEKMAGSYKELSRLADQIHEMDDHVFSRFFS